MNKKIAALVLSGVGCLYAIDVSAAVGDMYVAEIDNQTDDGYFKLSVPEIGVLDYIICPKSQLNIPARKIRLSGTTSEITIFETLGRYESIFFKRGEIASGDCSTEVQPGTIVFWYGYPNNNAQKWYMRFCLLGDGAIGVRILKDGAVELYAKSGLVEAK